MLHATAMLGIRAITLTALALGMVAASADRARAESCTPSRLMIMLDKSSSMVTQSIDDQTLWSIAVGAIDQLSIAYQDAVELGLMVFPAPDRCGPGAERVAPQLGARGAILAELADPPPTGGNWTPMSQTLDAALALPSLAAGDAPRFAVLVTDGWQWCSPYDPSTRFDPVDSIANLDAAGVKTYVVGFGSGVDALALNQMAVVAGTARASCDPTGNMPSSPNPCYYQADDPVALLAALMQVAQDAEVVRPCQSECGTGVERCENFEWQPCDAPLPGLDGCEGDEVEEECMDDPGRDEFSVPCDPGDPAPPTDPGDGTDDSGLHAGLCGCRAGDGASAAGTGLLLLGVALAGLRRRRRRG